MPTYDYVCEICGYSFEHFQPINDAPLTNCPKCQGSVKRKIGAGLGPIFKGTGFYQTDYKGNTSKPSDTSKNNSVSDSSDTNSSSSTSTEVKKTTE